MSHTAEFPARTAGELTLANGDVVFVQTLNTLLKEEADAKARRYAANEARSLLKGGDDYASMVAEVRGLTAPQQAEYLANQEYWSISQEALTKYPVTDEPTQGEGSPEEHAAALIKWEQDGKAAEEKRKKFEETRYHAEIKKGLALTEKVRVERCCTVYFQKVWGEYFIKQITLETLFRAVRYADDHSRKYFSSVQAVKDADDAIFLALNAFYFDELDRIKPAEIPPSPVA